MSVHKYKPVDIHSEEFKQWFGKSIVVEKDNSPRIVFHGTRFNFREFNINPEWSPNSAASFFTEDREIAESFGRMRTMDVIERPRPPYYVIRGYLRLTNPARLGDINDELTIDQLFERIGGNCRDVPTDLEDLQGSDEHPIWHWYAFEECVWRQIKKLGFDGATGIEQQRDMFAVFSPEQIRITLKEKI